jgi:hypothetical protein
LIGIAGVGFFGWVVVLEDLGRDGMIYVKGEWGFLIGSAIDNIAGVAGGLKYKEESVF